MKKIFSAIVILFFCNNLQAQHAAFISSGKITFERRINNFAVVPIFLKEVRQMPDDQLSIFMQRYRSTEAQFWTDSFDLYFDQTHSLYQPTNPDINFSRTFQIPIAYKNKVFSNFETNQATTEKVVFEKSFLINDSIKKIKWKLTEETREIAGYDCHRANGLIFDSVYVVAFYTDEVLTEGGPESFNGLPGMILGIAIPYQHITIFATSVKGLDTSQVKWEIPTQKKSILVNNIEFNIAAAKMLKQYNLASSWLKFFTGL